ncbi:class I SAM-dependent methyltransferase [Bacillus marasmi]|uniref:class I SAM-dependent methyltransferase n=1 Tax=Bacillus marasmi TaxID=1926279 RepID=UPI0011CBEBCA|nr:class I SAM-dependent methyltransferase [Bacillus marasmi]
MAIIQNKQDHWNANLYDEKHAFVSQFGQSVIELLTPKQGEKILDLGCGTGDLAQIINGLGATVVGVDKSENMVKQAQDKYPDIRFFVKDATQLEYHEEFDAVFSNATLHWVKAPKQALQSIYSSLKPGGRFVAELGGKGNVQKITDEVISQYEKHGQKFDIEKFPWYFPSIGEYTALMEEVGFTVAFCVYFDRPTPLEGENGITNWIEMFGSSLFAGMDAKIKQEIITNSESNLRNILYKNGKWVADYKRLRVIGIKH